MVTWVLLAAGIAAGIPIALVAVVALAVFRPWLFLVCCVVWAGVHRMRPRETIDEAGFLRAVGAELRAGATVRSAIAAVAADPAHRALRPVARLAAAGSPLVELTPLLRAGLPETGRRFAAAVEFGARTGGSLVVAVDRLVFAVVENAQLDHELRAATAQAKLSAIVVGVAPILFSGFLIGSGVAATPWSAGGLVASTAAAGITLQIAGLAVVLVMLRRGQR